MSLDFSRPVVLALHYQNEVLHPDGKFAFGVAGDGAAQPAVVRGARGLLDLGRRRRWPVVHVRIAYRPDFSDVTQNCAIFRTVVAQAVMAEGSWGAQFLEALAPMAGEPVVTHNRINAFFRSGLETMLDAMRPSLLLVGGVATNSVVEHTVRHATDLGWHSAVVEDACGAASPAVHTAALHNLRLLAEVGRLEEIQRLADTSGKEAR